MGSVKEREGESKTKRQSESERQSHDKTFHYKTFHYISWKWQDISWHEMTFHDISWHEKEKEMWYRVRKWWNVKVMKWDIVLINVNRSHLMVAECNRVWVKIRNVV